MIYRSRATTALALIALSLLGACREPPAASAEPVPAAASAPMRTPSAPGWDERSRLPPVAVADAATLRLMVDSEVGYLDARQQLVVDVLERDMVYLQLRVETADGHPVSGAEPEWVLEGDNSRLQLLSAAPRTDESGLLDFGLIGERMGAARLQLRLGDQQQSVIINVISLEAMGYEGLPVVDTALDWAQLMQARLDFSEDQVRARFPPAIQALNGQTVRVVGFMLPLDPDVRQRHFLLTANPPSCFFHIPGGPAGAVEVFAAKGLEFSLDPLLLEGRLHTIGLSASGVVYQLQDARLLKLE